jgi:hypothetical protein
MAYDNATPQASDQISSTQGPILGNFEFLDTGLATEHNFNAGGTGSDMYHKFASMPNQGSPPALQSGTNGVFYVAGGNAQFSDGTNISQLTLASPVASGYQWLGRVLIQWGLVTSVSSSTTQAFPIPFPTNVFSITMTSISSTVSGHANGMYVVQVGGTQPLNLFTWNQADRATSQTGFYWMAIGN